MEWVDRLRGSLPEELARALDGCGADELKTATELRVRPGGAVLVHAGGRRELGLSADLREVVEALTRGRMHALGECVRQGYVPLPGGFRAGICGRAIVRGGEVVGLEDISGVCIRISRGVRGAAAGVMSALMDGARPRSALILSAPGLGKTTLLRDAAAQLALRGLNVAVADERGELAGGGELGGADVMSLCPKPAAFAMLVRAMRPDVIVTDELGGPGDAAAAADAVRCGAAVVASAHADTPARAAARAELAEALRAGLFERLIAIGGPRPGEGVRVYDGRGRAL